MFHFPVAPTITQVPIDPLPAMAIAPEMSFGLLLGVAMLISTAVLVANALWSLQRAHRGGGIGASGAPLIHNHHPIPSRP